VLRDCRGVRREAYWHGNGLRYSFSPTRSRIRTVLIPPLACNFSNATQQPALKTSVPTLSTMAQGRREGSAGYSSDQAGDAWTRDERRFDRLRQTPRAGPADFPGRFNEPSFEMHLATTCRSLSERFSITLLRLVKTTSLSQIPSITPM
jgi:hypothetical protein